MSDTKDIQATQDAKTELVAVGSTDLFSIPMRPWERIEPDARRWAKEHYSEMGAKELRVLYGKGHRGKTEVQMRNMLVKRHVAFEMEQWSRDVSRGRKVNPHAL